MFRILRVYVGGEEEPRIRAFMSGRYLGISFVINRFAHCSVISDNCLLISFCNEEALSLDLENSHFSTIGNWQVLPWLLIYE